MKMAILDLPVPLEQIIIDLDRPLEEQLPQGRYLDAAIEFCKQHSLSCATSAKS